MSVEYSVIFAVDGSMRIEADSAEAAEREAIDILEGLAIMDAVANDIDGCTVRVSMHFDDRDEDNPKCSKVDRAPKVVEFG